MADEQQPGAMPSLPIRSVRIVPDPMNRTPGGMPVDLVELELMPPNDGNWEWFAWVDHLRFRVERGHADKAIAALGLKVKP